MATVHLEIADLDASDFVDYYHPSNKKTYNEWRTAGSPSVEKMISVYTEEGDSMAKAERKARKVWSRLGGGVKLHIFPELEFHRLKDSGNESNVALAELLYDDKGTPLMNRWDDPNIVERVRKITDASLI
jgi:hypothetical protein